MQFANRQPPVAFFSVLPYSNETIFCIFARRFEKEFYNKINN